MNVKKKLKNILQKESFSVFEGAPFKPFGHNMTYFRKMFLILFSTFIKNEFGSKTRFFLQKYAHNKKERNFLTARSSNCSVSAKFFSQCW